VRQRLSFSPKSRITAAEEKDAPYFYDGFDASLVQNGNAFVADSNFILVLQKEKPRAVRLCLSGDRGTTVAFGDSRRTISQSCDVLKFPFGTNSALLPFLRFEVDGHCRIQWAELVSTL
jgi:hypothetical protein